MATDIAARGIDVEALSHVVNFDVPNMPEDYIHRVGRTARAELTGDAITFVAPDEENDLRAIERAIGKRLPRVTVPDFDYTQQAGGEAGDPDPGAHRRDPRAEGGGPRARGSEGATEGGRCRRPPAPDRRGGLKPALRRRRRGHQDRRAAGDRKSWSAGVLRSAAPAGRTSPPSRTAA